VPNDADELTRNADAAMYIAKRDGKGGYRLFEPTMHEGVLARLSCAPISSARASTSRAPWTRTRRSTTCADASRRVIRLADAT
jgi:hypothetical protein